MLLNAYTLYDSKALNYSPPFYAPAHGAAVRLVMDLAADSNTSVGRHPADYTLYCVGRFDDGSGMLMPSDTREHISDVLPLVPKPIRDVFASAPANGRDAEMNFMEPERFPVK